MLKDRMSVLCCSASVSMCMLIVSFVGVLMTA